MYQALLSRRYLTHRIMPLLAAVAVVLCCAMVLITWSIMGGWLKMLLSAGRTQIGDVKISWPNRGFPYYEDLLQRLRDDPLVQAAAPLIETPGMLSLPNGRVQPVIVRGIDPASYAQVTSFEDTLHWRPLDEPTTKDTAGVDFRVQSLSRLTALIDLPNGIDEPGLRRLFDRTWEDVLNAGLTLARPNLLTGEPEPALVLGIEASKLNIRRQGWYDISFPRRLRSDGTVYDARIVMPINGTVTLTVVPFDDIGRPVDTISRVLPVANEFKTGIYELDENTVLAPLPYLQDVLNMDAAERIVSGGGIEIGPDGEPREIPPQTAVEPARVTGILVLGVSADNVAALRARCREICDAWAADHAREVPPRVEVSTWEELNRTFIDAVRHETALVLFVFSFISLTAVFLVWAIFWSMVSEKTKDVGVLRAIGASRTGVAWLWLRYAMAIGITGAVLGVGLAHLIVWNINPIHEWMGRNLSIQIWNPEVYYFVRIPNEVNPVSALLVFAGGILAAVAGAMVPALRAARMDPVRALRFE